MVLFLGVIGFYSVDWRYTLSNEWNHLYDGVSAVGAERVLAGDVPYRDFWTMYAPGHFYLLALLFRVFSAHLMVEVIAASIVCAAAACACYWLVVNLAGKRFLALATAGIFVAAVYNTGYFRRLGSYPTSILLVLVALNLMVLFYKTSKLSYLVAAGLFTGAAVFFKHDVAGYTAIASSAGLIAHHLLARTMKAGSVRPLLIQLFAFSGGIAVIVIPLLIYFGALAGPDMVQNLLIFPATDFRFSRPEAYPSLLPINLSFESRWKVAKTLSDYLNFTVPFVLFALGLIATGLSGLRRRPQRFAISVTLVVAFLLHYLAAHIQINTHIVTMSIYAALLGILFNEVTEQKLLFGKPTFTHLFALAVFAGWLFSLVALPAREARIDRQLASTQLNLPKVSGFRVAPQVANTLVDLSAFVDDHIPPDQELFVGLHRHDVVIIGDSLIYFVLDRPHATRYQELHPAITDTALTQREIISDLERNGASFIVLKKIFTDDVLESVKKIFQENLPQVGATDLDDFVHENYIKVQDFGPYMVWQRINEG